MGSTKSERDSNLYFLLDGESPILVSDVDNLFLIGLENFIRMCKEVLALKFEIKDNGLMFYFLELDVWQQIGEIFLR